MVLWLALVLLPLIWGYNWVVMKRALEFMGPLEFAAWRYLLGAAVLFAGMAITRRPIRARPVGALVAIGLLQIAANTGLTMWALTLGPAGRTAILTYTTPLWVLLLAWPLLGEAPTVRKGVALLSAGGGLALIVLSTWGRSSVAAVVLATLSGVVQAGGTILARKLLKDDRVDVLALVVWQVLVGGAALALASLLAPGRPVQWTPYLVGALAYEAVPATAFALWLWYSLLQKVEAGVASLATLTTPVIGILATALQLRERPAAVEGIGMALIFGSLIVVGPLAWRQARRAGRAGAVLVRRGEEVSSRPV